MVHSSEGRLVQWMQLGLALLVQTIVVVLFVYRLSVDVEYLKNQMRDSQEDRIAIRNEIKELGVIEYRLKSFEQTSMELKHLFEKHAESPVSLKPPQ